MSKEQKLQENEKPDEPTPKDRALVEVHAARKRANPAAPRIKVRANNNRVHEISADYPDDTVGWLRIMDALGVKDFDAASGLVRQIANAGTQGRGPDETGVNSMLSFVKGIAPRDQVEAMLAVQMAAVHNATITFARRLAHVENIAQQDSAERAFNKLARTFASQVETLKRYRSRGEQRVRIERVTMNEGGQAIVGNVTLGGAGVPKKRKKPHERGLSLPEKP